MCMCMNIYFNSLKTSAEQLTSDVHLAQQPVSDCGSSTRLQKKG